MVRHSKHPDRDAHEANCQETEDGEPCADPNSAYIDVFCSCHHYTQPKVLMNGTDIAWPAGWSQEQADKWRKEHGLVPPDGDSVAIGEALPQAGSESDPDQIDPLPTAGTGILPDPNNPSQNDVAPTG
jgi:hypothetical protein